MSIPSLACARRCLIPALAAALSLSLAACGGGDATDGELAEPLAAPDTDRSIAAVAQTHTLRVATTIPGHPHTIDVYQPAGATKAIVFLHGHGGRTGQLAHDLGLNSRMAAPTTSTVNWEWLAQNGIIAVFAQGRAKSATSLPTWSNYVLDSGYDDVAFLQSLSAHIKSHYGATEVSLAGHSSGGTMTARMWCEGTASYKAFVSLAGPMSSATYPKPSPTCMPQASVPYMMVVGGQDTKLTKFAAGVTSPSAEQIAAGLTDTILVSEWSRHQDRSARICGETPPLAGSIVTASGPTWEACNGRIRYTVISGADHPIGSLEAYAGTRMIDVIAGFVR